MKLDWRDTFPARRLSRGPVWQEQNASRPLLGTGKQLCRSIAAQYDQTERTTAEVKAHKSLLSKSSLLLPI